MSHFIILKPFAIIVKKMKLGERIILVPQIVQSIHGNSIRSGKRPGKEVNSFLVVFGRRGPEGDVVFLGGGRESRK
jgi:hypothetical protein